MNQRAGGKRNKQRGGTPKAVDHHNRPAKNKQQSYDAYQDNSSREGTGGFVGETKIEDNSHKTASISEAAYNQDVLEDVGQKDLEMPILDFNCNNSGCANLKIEYLKLLAEKVNYIETIKQLKEDIQRLTSKDYQNNAPQEIMEAGVCSRHTKTYGEMPEHVAGPGDMSEHVAGPGDMPEHVAGPSSYDWFDKSSELVEKSYKLRKECWNVSSNKKEEMQYGQRQGREGRNWRNNQAGEQPVRHNRILKEIEGDLFTAPITFSLAHCVAEDMRMGSGIAVTFRQTFKRVDELLAQEAQTGGMAVLEDEGRFIYYLVTKKLSHGKPLLDHLKLSLREMKKHMLLNNVHDVAMPKIGCGLDRLNWWDVRKLLIEIFGEDDVNITVYNFNQEQGERNQKSQLRIKHVNYSLVNIEHGTGLLYLGSEDGAISESLESLLKKFPILQQYKKATKCVGQFVRTEYRNEVLYGLIIKKNVNDRFSFTAFSQCLKNLRNTIQKDDFQYGGIDVFTVGDDPQLDTEKLLTIFKNAWFNVYLDLYICWPQKYTSIYKSCYEAI